jgi:hypothetical protein
LGSNAVPRLASCDQWTVISAVPVAVTPSAELTANGMEVSVDEPDRLVELARVVVEASARAGMSARAVKLATHQAARILAGRRP